MPHMIFDTQGTGFYKKAARQMMAQKEYTFLSGPGGRGLGDEIMLLEGLDDLGAMYPHGYDDGPARTYTMPTMDRGTLYDFTTGPVSTGMSGARLGASVNDNQGAWPRMADPRWRYTGLGNQPSWPRQQSRYAPRTFRFTGPSRTPSRIRMAVEASKVRLRSLMDESELRDFRRTAAVLAGRATGPATWTGAIDLIAFLELASSSYPDSAWLRGNARSLYNAVAGDSVTTTRRVLRQIEENLEPVAAPAVSGLRGASIRRGRYAYTGLLGGLADAQSDARTAMAIAQGTRDAVLAGCSLITNTTDKARCEAGANAAYAATRAAIVAGYGTDGTTPPAGGTTTPTAATQEQIEEKLRMQAEQGGVPTPPALREESDNTMLYVGGIALVGVLGVLFIMNRG